MGKHHEETQPSAPDVQTPDETAKLQAENAGLIDTLQRLQAEFENYRRRTEVEKADLRTGAADRLLGDVLPILDGLELAISHAKEHAKPDELLSGILMVRDQLLTLLADHGVTPMAEEGPFNPRLHEAIITEESKSIPSKHITKTFQRGYTRGERMLRPARVSVAK